MNNFKKHILLSKKGIQLLPKFSDAITHHILMIINIMSNLQMCIIGFNQAKFRIDITLSLWKKIFSFEMYTLGQQ